MFTKFFSFYMFTKFFSFVRALVKLAIIPLQTTAQTAAVEQQNIARLVRGTQVQVRVAQEVQSDDMGEVNGLVDQDVYSQDGKTLLISAGTPVVIHAAFKSNGSCGKPGKVTLNGASTNTVDGQLVNLHLDAVKKGGDKGGLVWPLVILFFPLGLTALAIKGGNPTIQQGTIFPATVTNDVKLQK